jgi:hypothetical protein
MKKYKVLYGDFMAESVMGKNLTKKQADKLCDSLDGGDPWSLSRIVEYEEFDIKEERKKKLEKIKKISDDKKKEPTEREIKNYYDKLLNKLKQDPLFDLRQEFGQMLMRHIDSFTTKEKIRYEELKKLLK